MRDIGREYVEEKGIPFSFCASSFSMKKI